MASVGTRNENGSTRRSCGGRNPAALGGRGEGCVGLVIPSGVQRSRGISRARPRCWPALRERMLRAEARAALSMTTPGALPPFPRRAYDSALKPGHPQEDQRVANQDPNSPLRRMARIPRPAACPRHAPRPGRCLRRTHPDANTNTDPHPHANRHTHSPPHPPPPPPSLPLPLAEAASWARTSSPSSTKPTLPASRSRRAKPCSLSPSR